MNDESISKNNKNLFSGKRMFEALENTDSIILSVNMRSPLSIEGIMFAAKELDSVVNFQLAMSELGYTYPNGFETGNATEFARIVREKAKKIGFHGFGIKGDHVTVNPEFIPNKEEIGKVKKIFEEILAIGFKEGKVTRLSPEEKEKRKALFEEKLRENSSDGNLNKIFGAIKKAQDLVIEEVEAGYTCFALDASFLPMELNIPVTAYLDGFLPEDVGHEGEVGEIGGDSNTPPEEAVRFIENLIKWGVRLHKIAINNGSQHGYKYVNGKQVETSINLEATKKVHEAIKKFNVSIVQHGITGTPLHVLKELREVGITEAHVGTFWQTVVLDNMQEELREEIYKKTIEKYDPKHEKSEEEVIGKNVKRLLGPYREKMLAMSEDCKERITKATKEEALKYFKALRAEGSLSIVLK